MKILFAGLALLLLAGCSTGQLSTKPGQLFCAIATKGGGQITAALVDATAASQGGALAGEAAVIATNATQAQVQNDCDQAAKANNAVAGVPISPPAASAPVATIAITPTIVMKGPPEVSAPVFHDCTTAAVACQ